VHLAHAGFPLVGDRVYGGRLAMPKGATEALRRALREFPRQALHAARLAFAHPVNERRSSSALACQPIWRSPARRARAGSPGHVSGPAEGLARNGAREGAVPRAL
jgi:23S rRNA-/tRNA-specific pseudouridylate synthase